MRGLACDDTTEEGADEVFIMVIGRRTDGATFHSRWPAEGQHWDMNDGDQPTDNPSGDSHMITKKPLFAGELSAGQSWDVVVAIMEEDGGNSKQAQEAASDLLIASANPFAVTGGILLKAITNAGLKFINDTDDFIGSFAVHIANDNGTIKVTWNSVDRVKSEITGIDNMADRGHEYRMLGDDSDYVGWYHINVGSPDANQDVKAIREKLKGEQRFSKWMTSAEYQQEFDTRCQQKLYPVNVQGKNENGIAMYRAVFADYPRSRFSFQARHGLSKERYSQLRNELFAQGYHQLFVHTFVDSSGQLRYSATWTK
jgi:hypothetical protein